MIKTKLRNLVTEYSVRNKKGLCTDVYSVTNSQGFIPSTDYFSKEVFSKDLTTYKIVKRGMVAYNPSRINVGSVAVQRVADEVIVSPLYVVFSVNEDELIPEFLTYFLHSDKGLHQISSNTSGSVRDSLKFTALKNIEINAYSLDEQKEIIVKFQKFERLIEKQKLLLKKLDDLVKSQFIEMFGGCDLTKPKADWVKIKEVAEVVGGSTPKTDRAEFWGGEHYWITPAEINEDSFIINRTLRRLTDEGVRSCSLRLLPVNTVILSSRAPIGKVAISGVEMYCNQGFKNLICSEKLNPIYAFCLLKFNTDYLNSLGKGATFKEISKAIVDDILIPLPSMAMQEQFASFVEQTDKSKNVYEMEVAA